MYGAAQLELRAALWNKLTQLLRQFSSYLIIGDINQVDSYTNKLGGAIFIRGWEDIINWKQDLQLIDIPYQGDIPGPIIEQIPTLLWKDLIELTLLRSG